MAASLTAVVELPPYDTLYARPHFVLDAQIAELRQMLKGVSKNLRPRPDVGTNSRRGNLGIAFSTTPSGKGLPNSLSSIVKICADMTPKWNPSRIILTAYGHKISESR